MIAMETLREVLVDNRKLVEGKRIFQREIKLPAIPRGVLVGIRRSGKSYLLYTEMQRRLKEGQTWDDMLYLNFEDERLLGFDVADFNKILEEAEKFREMFSKYRVVIKVPHTGAVTPQNVTQLLSGNKKLDKRPDQVGTEDALRGHNLALKLHEHGFRVNFTLMFEPFQTMLAMQARPYFINTFLRHRLLQSQNIKKYVDMYEVSKDNKILETLKDYFISCDYYTEADRDMALADVLAFGKDLLKYRHFEDKQGQDGLDGMRHNLRVLKNSNLKDTRLIVCSMEGPYNYPDIDKLLTEPEFQDMNHKVVITAEPNYLARFTSTNQVISYQRRFMNAANGQS